MAMPTAEELDRIRARAIERKMDDLVKGPRGYSFGNAGVKVMNEAGCIAVRDAIIEALAQEAETVYLSYNGYDDTFEFSASMRASVIDWLRSHQDAPPSH